ncbi:integrase [Lysinibacillus composti]|uniref:Tyr recombinase domain-containing protein n=1 Tax=Lysinibacillus composti TaxID=720633 RepID=A0A3N9UWE2_9BACI|nr:hypothetical protein [Lysinibacillus composti]MBM7607247.1 integrase [Lysinibacillus composti]RQW76176.1 hypothetical protein EBB45_01095 [Lysinibacillus composti]
MFLTNYKVSFKEEEINQINKDIKNNKQSTYESSFEVVEGINFKDNYWDFSNILESTIYSKNFTFAKYRFQDIKTAAYRFYLKKFVLRQLFNNEKRPSSVYGGYCMVKGFIKYLENEMLITVPLAIYDKIIENYINKFKRENYRRVIRRYIKLYFAEIEQNEMDFYLNEFRSLYTPTDMQKVLYEEEIGKTPNIPDRIYKAIIRQALLDLDNKELNLIDRMTAGLIILLSQIGLRIGEALLLEIGRLKEEVIFDGTKKAYKLEFWTYKTTGIKGKWTITFMTPLAIKAYKKLEELGTTRRGNGGKYLYPNSNGDMYTPKSWSNNSHRFFVRNQEVLGLNNLTDNELKQVVEVEINQWMVEHIAFLSRNDIGKTFYKVNAHQYRVAVCNYLRKKPGINLQWIKKHMNHLEEDMTIHYFRDDDVIQETLLKRTSENGDFLETKKENILDEDIRKELDDPYFIEAYNTINKFLKKKRLKIYKDLNEIINTFKNSPILDSEIGFCTNAMERLCERQEKLNQLEKWSYLRPQVPDITNFNQTYKRLITKLELVKHNKSVASEDSRYLREYELQLNTFNQYYNNKFMPEFELLKKNIENVGMNKVILNNPHLESIIYRFNEIEKVEMESREWLGNKLFWT